MRLAIDNMSDLLSQGACDLNNTSLSSKNINFKTTFNKKSSEV